MVNVLNILFESFIDSIVLKQLKYDQLCPETNTMINVVSQFTLTEKLYMGHRVQDMVQFDMTETSNKELLKGEKSRIIIVLDHQ